MSSFTISITTEGHHHSQHLPVAITVITKIPLAIIIFYHQHHRYHSCFFNVTQSDLRVCVGQPLHTLPLLPLSSSSSRSIQEVSSPRQLTDSGLYFRFYRLKFKC